MFVLKTERLKVIFLLQHEPLSETAASRRPVRSSLCSRTLPTLCFFRMSEGPESHAVNSQLKRADQSVILLIFVLFAPKFSTEKLHKTCYKLHLFHFYCSDVPQQANKKEVVLHGKKNQISTC